MLGLSKDIQVHIMKIIHSDQGGQSPNRRSADTMWAEGDWWLVNSLFMMLAF